MSLVGNNRRAKDAPASAGCARWRRSARVVAKRRVVQAAARAWVGVGDVGDGREELHAVKHDLRERAQAAGERAR